MHFNYAFIVAYSLNIYLMVSNAAVNLFSGHRKRELHFNNFPANNPEVNPREYNNYQQIANSDPGCTTQNENNNDDKPTIDHRTANITNPQNFDELINPSGHMYNLVYVPPHLHKQQISGRKEEVAYNSQLQQLNGNNQNLAYVGPQLFPPQIPNNYQNIHQFDLPISNANAALQPIHPNQLQLRPYHHNYIKDSKVPTKMEAPFLASQFLGYGQPYNQQFRQHQQQLPKQHQQLSQLKQQNPRLTRQHQHPIRSQFKTPLMTAPVHEQHEYRPYHSTNFVYMAPNNIYDLYRKLN